MTRSGAIQSQARPQKIEADGILRSPHFILSGSGSQAAWLHTPTDMQVRGTVLILPPFGFEYTHAHRTLLHLADRLALSGFATLRIDYLGAGDSSGDESSISAPDDWVQGAVIALRALADAFPDSAPSIVGLRLGALLAAAASAHIDVTDIVGWAPVDTGRSAGREVRALHLMSAQEDDQPGYVEAGGFRISDDGVHRLADLDISDIEPRILGSCLVVGPPDRPRSRLWADRMLELGVAYHDLEQPDFNAMMREPQDSEVPHETLGALVSWLGRNLATRTRWNEDAYLSHVRCAALLDVPDWVERYVVIEAGDRCLVGVFSGPDNRDAVARLVLLPNSGSVHHVGPNRLHVELSRALARAGVATLRFNLRNLGDSRAGLPADENHPYPDTAVKDVAACVAWACARQPDVSITIAGLCSGAHTAFHAAIDLPSSAIDHVVSINPLTFRFVPGMSLDTPLSLQMASDAAYYRGAMFDRVRWRRLLSGGSDVPSIMKFLRQRIVVLTVDSMRVVRDRLGLHVDTTLEENLKTIIANGCWVDLVFSSRDPGREIVQRDAGLFLRKLKHQRELSIKVIDKADHTFSRKAQRKEAITKIVRSVVARTPLELTRIPLGDDTWSQLSESWTDLFRTTNETSAFLTPGWIERWLKTVNDPRPGCGLIWRDSSGVAVAACVLTYSHGHLGGVPVRSAFLNTSGPCSPGCEHNDILALPAYRCAVYESLAGIVGDERLIDDLALTGTRVSLTDWVRSAFKRESWEGFRSESPYVDLDEIRASGTGYLNALSGNTRSQIRRCLRRYEADFGEHYVHRPESRDEALAAFDAMIELHDLRWASQEKQSGFSPMLQSFHRTLIDDLWSVDERPNDLNVDILSVGFGDHLAGVIYSLVCRGHVQFYQSGLAYHEDPRLKPGLACHSLAIEHYLGLGASEYDFLGGEVHPVQYKRSLSTDIRHLDWGHVELGTPRIKALGAARHMKRRLLRLAEQRGGSLRQSAKPDAPSTHIP